MTLISDDEAKIFHKDFVNIINIGPHAVLLCRYQHGISYLEQTAHSIIVRRIWSASVILALRNNRKYKHFGAFGKKKSASKMLTLLNLWMASCRRSSSAVTSRCLTIACISNPARGALNTGLVCNWIYTVRCRYNAANFLTNLYKRHPIAHPLGRGMGCLLWIQHLIDILLHYLKLLKQYLTIYKGTQL